MRIPDSLASMLDHGYIDEVMRPLQSGKEAQVFLVRAGDDVRVAKLYKDAAHRSFRQRSTYTEGRKVRNSRDQRAIKKRTRHGKAQDEARWRSTEVDMIYRLEQAGVRVPKPHLFMDGVLVMERIADANGQPAPRIGELHFSPEQAKEIFDLLLREVVRMLCAGIVHGDLSEFNVLMGADGPVVIDFPQAVDPASNQNARALLLRDVGNLHRFAARFSPQWKHLPYAEEMWELYRRNLLTPESELKGEYRPSEKKADIEGVLEAIRDAEEDELRRRGEWVEEDTPPSLDLTPDEWAAIAQIKATVCTKKTQPPRPEPTPPNAGQQPGRRAREREPARAEHSHRRTRGRRDQTRPQEPDGRRAPQGRRTEPTPASKPARAEATQPRQQPQAKARPPKKSKPQGQKAQPQANGQPRGQKAQPQANGQPPAKPRRRRRRRRKGAAPPTSDA